ncbi:MAG: hypothetical protein JXX29_23760 [Deltaproteobacteria bacterium]|nr:hypothetical protein [Deltaproteobacteria bacterium]MBN2674718.1 hypothetical protein [Deltaproteobacteria bacterium]
MHLNQTILSFAIVLFIGVVFSVWSCSSSDASAETTNPDSDADADADSDTDTDSDSETSSDDGPPSTDSDFGGLTDSGSDTGGDTDFSTDCAVHNDGWTTFVFVNLCADNVTFEGSNIEPGDLLPGQSDCRDLGSDVEAISSIRYWGYIGPNPGGEHHTLAEFTMNTDFYDFDWYNLSHVDAHNLPMAIVPLEASDDCRSLVCADELLSECPQEGQFYVDGELVSCVSPDRDNPDSVVARYFEQSCADAYSWSGDDAESMAACAGEDYAIVFCPNS